VRTILTSAAALLLAALAAAPARADLVIDGRGWGHGVGLSQYGAYGYALLEGRDHAWILGHYYTGTSLDRVRTGNIRVLLRRTRTPRLCGVSLIRDARGRRIRVSEQRVYQLAAISRGRIRVTDATRRRSRARVTPPLTVTGGASWCLGGRADNGVRNGAYRGRALISLDGRALLVVNRLAVESYLRSVVPSEMPSNWPAEALETQAVIARSYALRALRPTSAFDVYADVRSQVYGGLFREVPTTTAAVTATRGQVVTTGGQVAQTFFFSTSGGETANNEEVWGGLPLAYLRSVDDPHDDLSPYHQWTARFTDAQARRKLRDLGVGAFQKLEVIARTSTGRAATVEVTGKDGKIDVPAARIQALLGLRSTWFDVAADSNPAP
jgi:stage II sporulation protein D